MPEDAYFTHVTSALLRSWWLPPQLIDAPSIASCRAGAPHLNRRGVYVRRCRTSPGDCETVAGLRVATADRTIAELAEDLSIIDLVAVIDCALHRAETTGAALLARSEVRRPGARRLRAALDWSDGRSESAGETYLRLLLVWSGVQVEPQVVIETQDGAFIARADLLITGTSRLVEYDGAGHRDRAEHRRDLRRDKALLRHGFERFGYTDIELLADPGSIFRDATVARGQPQRPARLGRWTKEVQRSSLSRPGRLSLARRIDRFERDVPPRRRR